MPFTRLNVPLVTRSRSHPATRDSEKPQTRRARCVPEMRWILGLICRAVPGREGGRGHPWGMGLTMGERKAAGTWPPDAGQTPADRPT